MKCAYNKCNGSGLIPFKNKEGKTVPDTHIFCDCHDEYANAYFYALKPSDFDYSISYSYYRSLCREHGWQDPGSDYPSTPVQPQEQVIVHRHSDMSKQDYNTLQQTARRLEYLQKKVSELQERRKPRGEY